MNNLIKTLPYDQVDFRWISNHYDVHLSGTCMYNNRLCRFENKSSDQDDMYVDIYRLNFIESMKWYWKQWIFEKCVGYHWTYPYRKVGVYFYYRKPKFLYKWLFNLYYKTK